MSTSPEPTAPATTEGMQAFVDSQMTKARQEAGTGGAVDRRRLFRLLREENVSAYPLMALLVLGVGGSLASSAVGVLSPDIARTFGLTPQYFTSLMLIGQTVSFIVPLFVARFVQHKARRAAVLLVSQALWSVLTGLQGLAISAAMLLGLSILDRMAGAAQATVAQPLLIDLYPPTVRVRVVAFLSSATIVASLVASGVIVLLTGPVNLNWRGTFLVMGLVALISVAFAIRLRDPGYGKYDAEKVRAVARRSLDEPAVEPGDDERIARGTRLSMLEALRRIWMIRSMRIMLLAVMVGSLVLPTATYMQFYFADRFALDASGRAMLSLVGGVVSLASFVILAPLGDRIFQRSPKLMFYIAGGLGIFGSLLGVAQLFVYSIPTLVALTVATSAFVGLTGPALIVGTMSVVPAALRPHTGALTGLFGLVGTAAGTALLGGLSTTMGIVPAIATTLGIGIAAQIMGMIAGKYLRKDLDSVIEEVIEEEYVAHAAASGSPVPMLSVRNVEYHYGSTQVLFGVDMTMREGEVLALLGVNGAGKSTLLRAISGLGACSGGSIRLQGHDITYLDAERRTRLGITQVPGGKAVFPDLTVLENLRCYTFGLPAGERRAASRRIDDALAAFPNLADRLHLPASSLSGGEQQMLGLAKAYILRPKLLLIDELSLGLAPKVVGELLDAVRTINAQGTAVILVEQSVNVALAIAERAYFMERGQIRFEGPTRELRENREMLRSVFLAGAGEGAR